MLLRISFVSLLLNFCTSIGCSFLLLRVVAIRPSLSAITSMFGGQVIAPGYSPHLRKSGSRPVFFDLGRTRLLAVCLDVTECSPFAFSVSLVHNLKFSSTLRI